MQRSFRTLQRKIARQLNHSLKQLFRNALLPPRMIPTYGSPSPDASTCPRLYDRMLDMQIQMESPSERLDALMNEFRRDFVGWKLESARLNADGCFDLVKVIEHWTSEAEQVLAH